MLMDTILQVPSNGDIEFLHGTGKVVFKGVGSAGRFQLNCESTHGVILKDRQCGGKLYFNIA